jgi:two-component system sensor histidine kinase ChiS
MRNSMGNRIRIILVYVLGAILCTIVPLAVFQPSPSIADLSSADKWEVNELEPELHNGSASGKYRLRTFLPLSLGKDPVLLVLEKRDFDLYVGGQRLYSYRYDPRSGARDAFVGSFVTLDREAVGQPLEVVTGRASGQPLIGSYRLGTTAALQADLLKRDAVKLTLTVLFAAFCLLSLGLYIANRKELVYGYFSLFSFTLGYAAWVRSNLSHLAADLWWLDVIHDLSLPVGTFALIGFIEMTERQDSRFFRLLRRSRRLAGLVTVLCLAASLTSKSLYDLLLITAVPILIFIVFLAGFGSIRQGLSASMAIQRREARVLLFGYVNMGIVAGLHMMVNYPNQVSDMLRDWVPILFQYWSYDQIFVCTFLFDACLGYILISRVMETFRRVREYAHELERKNAELENMDRIKDDFLAKTSHELRTPLHGIIGLAESLLEELRSEQGRPQSVHNLELIVRSGRRLARLIQDIQDHAKLQHHNMVLSIKPVSLAAVVHFVLSILQRQADQKGVHLRFAIPDSLPEVLADEDRLQQILLNLVSNAVKFTPEGEISVSAHLLDNEVILHVTDTGIGVPDAYKEIIFEPFEQGDRETPVRYGGTGLGLAITRQLVELHGGRLWLEAPKSGSTFAFSLPLWEKAEVNGNNGFGGSSKSGEWTMPTGFEPLINNIDSPAPVNGGGPFILAVDDESVNLEVITAQLGRTYTVYTSMSAKQALEQIVRYGKPDLIILDVMMPDMSGFELCRHLRQTFSSWELPILLLSARELEGDRLQGYESGANDYLTKPISKEELSVRVRMQLELSSLTRSLEDRVSERTKQLEVTMRETIDALDQIALLEERNRIAQEIHDTLGHHLVGSITQLEAAKRLFAKKPELVQEKLDMAQKAVRQGLEDVRMVIHAMKDSLIQADLRMVLNGLLDQTARMMEVQVTSNIGVLKPMNALQKRILYRALQEGLTNGIKHGQCSQFEFLLYENGDRLHFVLRNNGHPYIPTRPGMGLVAIRDRIGLLGGEVSIRTEQDGWTELRIQVPLHQPFVNIESLSAV